jgi:hypothetical protein
MYTPAPVYTFLVDTIDYQTIYSQPLPNTIDNVLKSLNDQAVYIPYLNKPLKNGDIFTLFGKKAQYVYDAFINKTPKTLKLLAETSRIPTLIKKEGFDITTLPILSAVSNVYISTIFNYSGKNATFSLNAFLNEETPCDISLSKNGVFDNSSPNNSFIVSINNNEVVNLTLNSDNKFYYNYTELVFE